MNSFWLPSTQRIKWRLNIKALKEHAQAKIQLEMNARLIRPRPKYRIWSKQFDSMRRDDGAGRKKIIDRFVRRTRILRNVKYLYAPAILSMVEIVRTNFECSEQWGILKKLPCLLFFFLFYRGKRDFETFQTCEILTFWFFKFRGSQNFVILCYITHIL